MGFGGGINNHRGDEPPIEQGGKKFPHPHHPQHPNTPFNPMTGKYQAMRKGGEMPIGKDGQVIENENGRWKAVDASSGDGTPEITASAKEYMVLQLRMVVPDAGGDAVLTPVWDWVRFAEIEETV